jgi:hypothetical protein
MRRLMCLVGLAALVTSGLVASAGSSSASASGSRPDALPGDVEWTLVDAVSARNVWATGQTPSSHAVIARWNGKSWKLFATPAGLSTFTSGMSVLSKDDAWVAGTSGTSLSMMLRWNGTSWQQVPSPNPGGYGDPAAVDMRTPDSGWAVGSDYYGPMIL